MQDSWYIADGRHIFIKYFLDARAWITNERNKPKPVYQTPLTQRKALKRSTKSKREYKTKNLLIVRIIAQWETDMSVHIKSRAYKQKHDEINLFIKHITFE